MYLYTPNEIIKKNKTTTFSGMYFTRKLFDGKKKIPKHTMSAMVYKICNVVMNGGWVYYLYTHTRKC